MLQGKDDYNFWGKVDYNFKDVKNTIKHWFYWLLNPYKYWVLSIKIDLKGKLILQGHFIFQFAFIFIFDCTLKHPTYSHSMSYVPKPTKKFSFSTIIGTLCIRIISIICIIRGFCCQNLLSLIHWQQNLKVSGTAVQMPYYSTK